MIRRPAPVGLPLHRFPVDPWGLIETEYSDQDLGHTETLFAVGNGYLGMRANPEEGRDAHSHGTFVNGFHETWRIQHAEDAYGFATTGQTIVNVPDAKLLKLYVDDEPFLLSTADLESYQRMMDFRRGVLTRDVVWRTPAGKRVRVTSRRMVSLTHRHLAVMTFDVTLLDTAAPVVVSSQLLNRQDGEDEYHVRAAALGEGKDPRRSRKFSERVLEPRLQRESGNEVILGYRCAHSGMTLACGTRHFVETPCHKDVTTSVGADLAKWVVTVHATPNDPVRITKLVTYHTSTGVPAQELADRCTRTLERAEEDGLEQLFADQEQWLDGFWSNSDIVLRGDDRAQQALRWNLFQLAQASARTQEQGIAAKAVTGGGYDGHYFWDSEVYVVPFLAYTDPEAARQMVRFRWKMLGAARTRAKEMSQRGALYPWRTINGEEASAYYAAGTAQYHINAAVVFALHRYLEATGDLDFLAVEGAEMLVETARLWADLGFFATNGSDLFHIHRVTGPDEYTTVVNDNMYTNTMARFNLSYAARTVRLLAEWSPDHFAALCRRTNLDHGELDDWDAAADAMYIPFDDELGIHPQDSVFLELEQWDWEGTPADEYPLLLHYHPLVIYRHQVLKQADVVLAMFLQGGHFDEDQKRRNFDYYDPITTGDSSLSACVQSIVAAKVGYGHMAVDYFQRALYLDLDDCQGNTADGVHIASAGGTWAAVVHGFAGMNEHGDHLRFDPQLPDKWDSMTFHLRRHGSRLRVELDGEGCTLSVLEGGGIPIHDETRGRVILEVGEQLRIDTVR
jgi:alpha,alpha-trehalose phosphorylase